MLFKNLLCMECIGHGILLPTNESSACDELLAEMQRVWPFLVCSPRTQQKVDDAARCNIAGLWELTSCYQPPCLEIMPAPSAPSSALRVPDAVCSAPSFHISSSPPSKPKDTSPSPRAFLCPPAPPGASEQATPKADSVQVNLSAQRESFVMQTMRQAHYNSVENLARADSARLSTVPSCPQIPGPNRDSRRSLNSTSRPWTTGPRLSAATPVQEPGRPAEEPLGRVQFKDVSESLRAQLSDLMHSTLEQEIPRSEGGREDRHVSPGDSQCHPEFSDFGNELLAMMKQGSEDGAERKQVCNDSWVDARGQLEDDSEHSEFYHFIEKELAKLPQQHAAPALPDSNVSFDSLSIHVSPKTQQIIEPTPAAVQQTVDKHEAFPELEVLQPNDNKSFSSKPVTPKFSDSISADITESLLVEGRPLSDHLVQEDPQVKGPSEDEAGYSGEVFDSSDREPADAFVDGGSALLDEVDALLKEPGEGHAKSVTVLQEASDNVGPAPEEGEAGLVQGLDDELAGLVDPGEQDLLGSIGGELRELLMDSGDESVSIPSEI